MSLRNLNVISPQAGQLCPSQTAAEKDGQDGAVSFRTQAFATGSPQYRRTLILSEPVSGALVFEQFNAVANNVDGSGLIVALVCDAELRRDLMDLTRSTRLIVQQMRDGDLDSLEAFGDDEFIPKFTTILQKMRDWIERIA